MTCRTPDYSSFDGYTGEFVILVQGRLLENAICDAALCKFVYDDSLTPTVSTLSKTGDAAVYRKGETVTLTGTKFQSAGATVEVWVG